MLARPASSPSTGVRCFHANSLSAALCHYKQQCRDAASSLPVDAEPLSLLLARRGGGGCNQQKGSFQRTCTSGFGC